MLIVGLGNPGPEYQAHRHNIGFTVVEALAERWRAGAFRGQSKFEAEIATCQHGGETQVLLKPQTFMNLSGRSVGKALAFYQKKAAELVVVHDEIDLPLGKLRLKQGGGHGGHNGLRSIQSVVGAEFIRVRLGVGRPPQLPTGGEERDRRVADYVLSPFPRAEQAELSALIGRAAEALEALLARGLQKAMNDFNQ
jgi:PTH1 family peptidyl-tRNA hydrolase